MQKSEKSLKAHEIAPARGRGRPRAFDRDAALKRATHLFWRKGFEATSISDLTEAMGIGSPSLYAAFGSKEALYVEALNHYGENYEPLVWDRFRAAGTAREAVMAYLLDSAAVLSGSVADNPPGCMVALASVCAESQAGLAELLRSGRALGLDRIEARLERAVAEGELPAALDRRALARFVQTVQAGMSIQARDGADRAELEAAARIAMLGWDARIAESGGARRGVAGQAVAP
jgi:AcrR family transcriptional regulator